MAKGLVRYQQVAGNLLSDGTNSYTYDAENRITSVTAPGGVVTHYVYGADGKRVEKQTPSSYFFYDYDDDGSLDATYTLSGTTLTATTQDLFLNGEHLGFFWENSNIYRSALDQVGSVRTRVDPSANIVSADRSFPFGEMQTEYLPGMATYGDTEDTIHFTGKERDAESGLDYFGARYYNSNMGRFLSPDWSAKIEPVPYSKLDNPQSLNLYAYVLNNPLAKVDPDGHSPPRNNHAFPVSNSCVGNADTGESSIGCGPEEAQGYVAAAMAQQQSTPQTSDNTLLAQNNTPPPPGRTPAQGGTPGSTVVIPDGKGGSTTRTYGPDGKATTDIDTGHDHGAGDLHAHDWDWGTKPPRQPGRPLTPEEQANIKKTAAGVVVGVGTGYIIYRVIRFLPSLAPPLWPTIPANAIIP